MSNHEARGTSHSSLVTTHLLVLAGYLLATVVFTWPLAAEITTAIPGDSFDGWQNYWNLWWLKVALVERVTNPLFTDLLYTPTGVSLYFHTLNPFNGMVTLPIQLTAGLMPAYNAVVFLSWTLAGYGMFLLARWFLGTHPAPVTHHSAFRIPHSAFLAPFFAGLVYTLAPFHMAHLLGHMQVMSLEWLPFYVLFLLRSLWASRQRRPWLGSALLAGFFLALNGLCDWYFVLYLVLFTGVAVAWGVAFDAWSVVRDTLHVPRTTALRHLGHAVWATAAPAAVAGIVFGVLLSPWLVPMVQEAAQYRFMVRPPADLYILSASAMDFLAPNRLHTLFRPESFTWIGNQIAPVSERTIAIGYIPLVLAIAALALNWRRAAFWWVAAIFFFLLALGPAMRFGNITWDDIPATARQGQETPGWSLYSLLNQWIPFMRISRSVSRFALMVQFCMALLSGMGLAALLTRFRPRWGYALTGVAMVGLLAEYWVAPYPLSPPDTPGYYATLADDPDPRAVLNLPMNYDRPGYLLYQTVHHKPLTVAYISRDDPRTLTTRVPVLQQFRNLGPDILDGDVARVAPTVLADLGVGTVVLDRYKMPGGDERAYTEALAQAIFTETTPVYADDRITVFKAPPLAAPQPYLRLGPVNWGPRQLDGDHPYRVLTGGPAAVEVIHPAATTTITLEYRTPAGQGVRVLNGETQKIVAELPPAPDGGQAVIVLAAVLPTAAEETVSILLTPETPGDVRVTRLALQV